MKNKQPLSMLLGIAAGTMLATNALAVIINVPGDFGTIQAAIADSGTVAGDEIVVAAGAYPEAIDFLGKAITVRSSDGPAVTLIIGGAPVVAFINLEGPDTVLDGFTIQSGNAVEGGGLVADFSDPTVTNCIFSGNSASRGAGAFLVGSTITFTGCTFLNNTATDAGAGVYCNASSPQFILCTFQGNDVTGGLGDGGAMYNTNFSNALLMGCTFTSNTAIRRGGAVANTSFSPTTFDGCSFTSNATQPGAPIQPSTSRAIA